MRFDFDSCAWHNSHVSKAVGFRYDRVRARSRTSRALLGGSLSFYTWMSLHGHEQRIVVMETPCCLSHWMRALQVRYCNSVNEVSQLEDPRPQNISWELSRSISSRFSWFSVEERNKGEQLLGGLRGSTCAAQKLASPEIPQLKLPVSCLYKLCPRANQNDETKMPV